MQHQIIGALQGFSVGRSLRENATALLRSIGYHSERTLETGGVSEFLEWLETNKSLTEKQRAQVTEWKSVDGICQVTADDLTSQFELNPPPPKFDLARIESIIFLAVELKSSRYNRRYFANITRMVNRSLPIPVVLIFHHQPFLTLSIIHRRQNKLAGNQDVLENVTLIKDIDLRNPHRAHVEILADLSLQKLLHSGVRDFDGLHTQWESVLGVEKLNQQFYKELFDWYQLAVTQCRFPNDAAGIGSNERHVIRMITRLLFVWFLKEKRLVPASLFIEDFANRHLTQHGPDRSDYYKAVLQNLFFATLNTEISERGFANPDDHLDSNSIVNSNLYKYRSLMKYPKEFHEILQKIPFVNGGLFDSLDRTTDQDSIRWIDTFAEFQSEMEDVHLQVPSRLFFDSSIGLYPLLERYKFTIEENTPVEQEVALDPELLGRVFENLLAAYNPETRTTIRKSTGSYYTPRQVVEYLVNESIIAILSEKCSPSDGNVDHWHIRLRHLLEYEYPFDHSVDSFDDQETESLVNVLATIRILDPAVGSGAFPMSVLQKVTLILRRIDPHNHHWEQVQKLIAGESASVAFGIDSEASRTAMLIDISKTFSVYRESDYGRKLFLIQNGIFGVDIQPIACQIAKLRFFITLIVEQQPSPQKADNYGIRPLPNLETRFVAANALIPLVGSQQLHLGSELVSALLAKVKLLRERYFNARTRAVKTQLETEDAVLRKTLATELKSLQFSDDDASAIAAWNPYDQNISATWFGAEWMFGVEGGFDVVLGNPPYVRADVDSADNLILRRRVSKCGLYETLKMKWDRFLAFMERSFKLCRINGVTSLIVSDAFSNAPYAASARNWYVNHAYIERVDFFPNLRLFDASVQNISYLFRRREGGDNVPQRRIHVDSFGTVKHLPSLSQSRMGVRVFSISDTLSSGPSVVSIASNRAVGLGSLCYISTGMVCNAHEYKARYLYTLRDVVSDMRDRIHSKPFVEGKHLQRWSPHTVHWLEWDTERAPNLFRRKAFVELFDQDQNIVTQLSPGKAPKACYDDTGLYHNSSVIGIVRWCQLKGVRNRSIIRLARYSSEKRSAEYPRRETLEDRSLPFDHKYILACINSSYVRDYLGRVRRSNIHIYPDDWRDVPIPVCPSDQQEAIVFAVGELLAALSDHDFKRARQLDKGVDTMVLKLYKSVNI